MEVDLKSDNGILKATIQGEINISTSSELKKQFEKVTEPNILINMAKVGYVDSSGLATLVEILKKAKANGGRIHLTQLSEKVYSLFEITKLDKLFGIFDNDEEAISKF